MRRATLPAFILAVLVLSTAASYAQPTGEQVVAAIKRGLDSVRDYTVDLSLTVKGPQISINNMRMTVYYKKPNKLHVDAKQGFGVVPRGNLFGNPIEELARGARPVYLRSEKKNGRDCHVIKLDPAGSPGRVTVWVDKARSVVLATSTDGPHAASTQWRYEAIDGRYYLPIEIRADSQLPRSPNGKAVATLKFSNYRVNKGISDRVFKDEKPRSNSGHWR